MNKRIVYNGNQLFKINFGLYGFDDIDFDQSTEEILSAFSGEYEEETVKALNKIGLEFVGFEWFSPKEYNFSNDSIDLIIRVKDKKRLKRLY